MHRRLIALSALALAGAGAAPHKVVRDTAALDFSYEWPAQAVAIPALDLRFYNEAKAKLTEAQKNAAEDQALAKKQKRDFNQHDFSGGWDVAGETARLLSLQGNFGGFEGGAHPNSWSKAILWDRKLNREIGMGALLTGRGNFAALTRTAYCKALDAERASRREGEKLGGEFDECPNYTDLAIAPVDKNGTHRFDAIDFVASPYVAGPYVEGEYELELPVTSRLIEALKPEYRDSFEVQRQ
jgi:hypothetical protein